MAVVIPITTKAGKLSGAELSVSVGRVNGAAILSAMRALDYTARDIEFESDGGKAIATEANRRIKMFPP